MKLLHYIKEGGAMSYGVNIMTNDRNAYFNIRFRIPLFWRYKLPTYYVFDQDVHYYGVVVSPIWCARIRLRTWRFVSTHYTSLWKRLKTMVCCGFRSDLRTISWEWSQTEEEYRNKLWTDDRHINTILKTSP